MNKIQKIMTMASLNAVAFGLTTTNAVSFQQPSATRDNSEKSTQMSEGQVRAAEASHLEVYAGCKWGHAAFDPVQVAEEIVPTEVLALHMEMV